MPMLRLTTVHAWAGLIAAVLLLVQASTGLLFTHQQALVPLLHPEARVAAGPRAPLDRVLAAIEDRCPKSKLDRIVVPDDPTTALIVRLVDPDGAKRIALVDPVSARVLSSGPILAYPEQAAEPLHGSLMLGKPGKWIVRITGFALLFMAVTGLILWWPKRGRRLRDALTVHLKAPPRRVLRDLHLVPGALMAVFFVISGATGVLLTLEPWFQGVVARAAPMAAEVSPDLRPHDGPLALSAEDALARLQARFPTSRPWKLRTLDDGRAVMAVFRTDKVGVLDAAVLDRATGDLIVLQEARTRLAGDRILGLLAPLHAAETYGPLSKVVATIMGLVLAAMALSGPVLRFTRPARRRPQRAGA